MSLLLAVLLAQTETKLPVKLAGKHYDVKSDATKEQAQELLDFLETVHGTYRAVFREMPERRMTVLLFKDRAEYLKTPGVGGASAACYDGKRLAGYWDETLTKPCFAHEAVHQFVHFTSTRMTAFPEWFHEGFADALADYEVADGKMRLATGRGAIARMRLPVIRGALQNGSAIPLAKFLSLSEKKFQEGSPLTYAEAWSLCHFLLAFEDAGGEGPLPNGKYRRRLLAFHEALRPGATNAEKAWGKAFKDVKIEDLDREWRAFVGGLK